MSRRPKTAKIILFHHRILHYTGIFRVGQFNGVLEIYHRLTTVANVAKIWDSTSNDEIINKSANINDKKNVTILSRVV